MPTTSKSLAVETYDLGVELRLQPEGPAVHTEPVRARDLADPLTELWFGAGPRSGRPDLRLEELEISLRPIFSELGAPWCLGFGLEGRGPGAAPQTSVFDRSCLAPVARRGAQVLRERGLLQSDQLYYYWVRAEPAKNGGGLPGTADGLPATPQLAYEVHPLPPLLAAARTVGPEPTLAEAPVFYTAEARAGVERIARRGAGLDPVVETGCVLVGVLVSCPETGEMYTVVLDAIEATEATSHSFSLTFTGATWQRIQAVLRARGEATGMGSQRILGQAHSHPFLPAGDGEVCGSCAKREACERTTAFLSADDLEWCRAVFSAEPWQLSHVFGLDARGGAVDAFYGQIGGRLALRGYGVLDHSPFPLP